MNKYLINKNIVINGEEELGEEKEKGFIAYNIDEDRIFVFNPAAYEIYCLIDKLSEEEKVCSLLKEKYNLEEADLKEINRTIEDMVDKEIILKAE